MLFSFSGLDGAGKSTLIEIFSNYLLENNKRFKILTMYDDVGLYAFMRKIRDGLNNDSFDISKNKIKFGNNPEDIFKAENNGFIKRIILKFFRHYWFRKIILVLDICIMYLFRFYYETIQGNILIMDRYFYDSLVDILIKKRSDIYANFIIKIIPHPTLPIFIDVPPEIAFGRKGEFTKEYLHDRYKYYQRIFNKECKTIKLDNIDYISGKKEFYDKVIKSSFSY